MDLAQLQAFVNQEVARNKMLMEIGDVVSEVSGLEQYKHELNTLIDAAKSDLAGLRATITKEQTDAAEKLKNLNDSIVSTGAAATQQTERAKADLAAVAAKHEGEIKVIAGKVADANRELDKVRADVESARSAQSAAVAAQASEIKQWQDKLAAVKAEYEKFVAGLVK